MKTIKLGDIVGRISYNKDIIFIVKEIQSKNNVLLSGMFERIIADADIDDLVIINPVELKEKEKQIEKKIYCNENRFTENTITGKILHLDADCIIIYLIIT